jgi:hypothetical protein
MVVRMPFAASQWTGAFHDLQVQYDDASPEAASSSYFTCREADLKFHESAALRCPSI